MLLEYSFTLGFDLLANKHEKRMNFAKASYVFAISAERFCYTWSLYLISCSPKARISPSISSYWYQIRTRGNIFKHRIGCILRRVINVGELWKADPEFQEGERKECRIWTLFIASTNERGRRKIRKLIGPQNTYEYNLKS